MRVRALLGAAAIVVFSVVGLAGPAVAQAPPKEVPKVSKECIEKLEKGGKPEDCQEAPSVILPAVNEIIYGGISFFILLLLMWKLAYPGIKKTMEARTEKIRDNLDEADRTRADAQGVLEDYQRQLADAKNESSRIIEEARQTAEQMRRDLMERAEAEVADLRQRSQDDIAAAQQRALSDLRSQVSGLAIELAEKVVEKSLDRDTNLALIERYIDQVGANGRSG